MRDSTKVSKKRKRESTIIHGLPQNFFQGSKVTILFVIFKLLTISVPTKIILHWANICFSEDDYFRIESEAQPERGEEAMPTRKNLLRFFAGVL